MGKRNICRYNQNPVFFTGFAVEGLRAEQEGSTVRDTPSLCRGVFTAWVLMHLPPFRWPDNAHGNGAGTPKRDAAVVSRHHIGVQQVVESPKVVFTSHSDGKVSKDGRIPSISTLQFV